MLHRDRRWTALLHRSLRTHRPDRPPRDQTPDGRPALPLDAPSDDRSDDADASPMVTHYAVSTSGAQPWDVITDDLGNVWFTESFGNKIGKITPAGVIAELALPEPNSRPLKIARALDGAMWFTAEPGKIGRITPSGATTFYR